MGEDLDVDAMLEAAFEKKGGDGEPSENQSTETEGKSRSNGDVKESKGKEKDRDREREKDKDRDREREKDKDKEKSRDRKGRDKRSSRSRDRRRSRSRDRKRSRSRSRDRDRKDREKSDRRRSSEKEKRRSRSPRDKRKSRSPRRERERGGRYDRKRSPTPPKKSTPAELTAEERDARTVFCMQLSQRVRARDLEDFFSAVGKVKDVRLIMCNKTRRFKGLCYVEFASPESVSLAIALTGQKLLGVPIVVQPTQAEKNRLAAANAAAAPAFPKGPGGPMRLYVGSLHFNITEDMLRSIFEPFGKIDSMQLMMDPETGRSKGYCFITYQNGEDAKKAMEQLNGFELAGRPMKINYVTEHFSNAHASFDSDEMDRAGIDLGTTGRLQLMAKLAQGTGLEIPDATKSALTLAAQQQQQQQQQQSQFTQSTAAAAAAAAAPPIATPCFMLSNMFDPNTETHPLWDVDIRDDVIDECNNHGGVVHIYVDKTSPQGNVYVKCPSVKAAFDTVTSLHGRWFAGRVITAAYVPLQNYNALFPDTVSLTAMLVKRG